ncbi:MAG: hemolysin family protein [Chloroflexota bacterium]
MPPVTTEIVIVLILIVINGVFALSETAVLTARKVRLEHMAASGDSGARAALQLSNEPSQFLSTVQVGITLVGVFSGAFGGVTLANALAVPLASLPVVGPYAEALSLGCVVVIITYLTLIFGELVPKRLALNSPERAAAMVAGPMRSLARFAGLPVALLTKSTELVLRAFGAQTREEAPVSEEELRILIDQGRRAGVFNEAEQDTIDRVLRFRDRRASTLMTPRPEIVWLNVSTPLEAAREFVASTSHGHYPLCTGSLDNVIGVISARDVLQARPGEDLAALASPALFIPETFRGFHVLETFRQHRAELGLVIDEYGGVEGLVTLKDLLEAIVGDVPASDEEDEPAIVQRADGSWLVDGLVPLDQLRDTIGLNNIPPEATEQVHTLAGLMLFWLQRLPQAGDTYEWRNWRFEIVDTDNHRIDKVLISRLPIRGGVEPGA